jgi:hypothetical protein
MTMSLKNVDIIKRDRMSQIIHINTPNFLPTSARFLLQGWLASQYEVNAFNVYNGMLALYEASQKDGESLFSPEFVYILTIMATILCVINQSGVNIGFALQAASYFYTLFNRFTSEKKAAVTDSEASEDMQPILSSVEQDRQDAEGEKDIVENEIQRLVLN